MATGFIGFLNTVQRFRHWGPEVTELALAGSANLLAAVGGGLVLRHVSWARWLLAAWMVFHVGLSAFHSVQELLVHVAIFIPLTYFLFRRQAAEYFDARLGSE